MTKARRSSGGWLLPTVLLFVLLPVAYAVYTGIKGGEGEGTETPERPKLSRQGSTEVDSDVDEPLALDDEPASYELRYRIERYDPDKVQVSEDRITVRRPFDGRVTSFIGGRQTGDRASRFGTLIITTGEGPRTLVSPPAPATGDLRLAPALADAVEEKWLQVRERREVLGRECQVYRAGSTVGAGTLVPVGTTEGEHSDFCVDATGLLLEEVWFKDGLPLQRRVATLRKVGETYPDDRFRLAADEPALTIDQGNGFIREVDPMSAFEGTVYRLAEPPADAEYVGRYVVQPPTLSPFQSPLDTPAERREQVSMVDVWVRGHDLVVFSQTIAADISAVPTDAKTAEAIELGPIDRAATVLDLRSNEVRAELPEARFLRLAGSVTRQELLDLAGSLRAEEGKGLVFLEP